MTPLFRLPSVRHFVFRTGSQIGIHYRDSPLSEGVAGGLRGGDRLPWVPSAAGAEDNFAPLTSLAWQVHVYGEPRRGVAEACAERRLPIHVFAWRPGMRRRGLMRGALYLVRPDGYVGLADPEGDPARLAPYFMGRGFPAAPRRDEATRADPLPAGSGPPEGRGPTSAA